MLQRIIHSFLYLPAEVKHIFLIFGVIAHIFQCTALYRFPCQSHTVHKYAHRNRLIPFIGKIHAEHKLIFNAAVSAEKPVYISDKNIYFVTAVISRDYNKNIGGKTKMHLLLGAYDIKTVSYVIKYVIACFFAVFGVYKPEFFNIELYKSCVRSAFENGANSVFINLGVSIIGEAVNYILIDKLLGGHNMDTADNAVYIVIAVAAWDNIHYHPLIYSRLCFPCIEAEAYAETAVTLGDTFGRQQLAAEH